MNVVAIGSHPDDIEFNCAGTLLRHVQDGDRVVMIIASDGATENIQKIPIRTREEGISEAKKAAEIIGATIHILDHKALDIPYNHKIVAELESLIHKYDTDIVYTHSPIHTNQDHFHLSMSTLAASRCVRQVYLWEEGLPHEQCTGAFKPDLYVDITAQMPKKIEAIKAHTSQIRKYTNDIIESLDARARFRGYQIRTRYAECFKVQKIVR